MIPLFILSIILLTYSFIFYRKRQYHIAKPIFVVGMVLMAIAMVAYYFLLTTPYP